MAQFEDTKAITGTMVSLFANGYPCGVVTNVEVQIRRDVQPLHVMFGTPNPAAWGYGIRRVSGRMDFASINGEGAMGIVPTGYKYYMSMTESLEILDDNGDLVVSGDEAIDDTTGLLSDGYSAKNDGGENYANSLASLQLKEAALASLIDSGGSTGMVTWTKQTPRYLDQVTNVNLTFIAFLEGQVAKMYSRTLYQMAFHTHNIQVGMTVGAIETCEYFANNISRWSEVVGTTNGDTSTSFDVGSQIPGFTSTSSTSSPSPDSGE